MRPLPRFVESYLRARFQSRLHGNFTIYGNEHDVEDESSEVKNSARNPDGTFLHFPTTFNYPLPLRNRGNFFLIRLMIYHLRGAERKVGKVCRFRCYIPSARVSYSVANLKALAELTRSALFARISNSRPSAYNCFSLNTCFPSFRVALLSRLNFHLYLVNDHCFLF